MKTANPKVLHIIDSLGIGGAERLLVNVVNSMPEFKHYVVFLKGSDILSKELNPGIDVIHLGFRSKLDYPRSIFRLRKLIKQENIPVIHSHLFASTFIARMAAPKWCRVISTLHSMPVERNYFGRMKLIWGRKLAYNKERHHIIAVSEAVFAAHHKQVQYNGGYTILPNFIRDQFFREDYKRKGDTHTLKLVAVGNLRDVKNHDYLLEAFRLLPSLVTLDIFGEGHLNDSLQEKIDRYDLPVRLGGLSNNMDELLPGYDAYITASRNEGHPLSLMEAMASGLPVILSDIPVFKKIAGKDAVYFNLDEPGDLAGKIMEILEKKISLDTIAKANFEKMSMLNSKSHHISTLFSLYSNAGASVQSLKINNLGHKYGSVKAS